MDEALCRPGTAADEAAILELLGRSLGGTRSPDLHEWKHRDSPFGPSYSRVAEVEGKVVAWRAFLRWEWQSAGRAVSAVRAVDTATDPGHRRRGLFSRLTRELVEEVRADGVAFVFNTPGPQSLPGYLKLGWRISGRVPLLVRPLRPWRAGLGLLWSGTSGGAQVEGTSGEPLRACPQVRELLSKDTFAHICPAIVPTGRRFSTCRTADYLAWRYGATPGFDYRALWSLEPGKPAAIVFHAGRRRGLTEVKIAEVLTTGTASSRRAASALLRRLVRMAAADYLIACAAPGTAERSALLRAGFLPASRLGPQLTVLPLALEAELPDPCKLASWRPSLGDLEIF